MAKKTIYLDSILNPDDEISDLIRHNQQNNEHRNWGNKIYLYRNNFKT